MDNNSRSAKWIIIGSICVTISSFLAGINEVIIKASGFSVAQACLGRFGTQFILAVLWWNCAKPSTPYIFRNHDGHTNHRTTHWYGDSPYITNNWLRGMAYAITILFFYIALILLPIGDVQCLMYQAPLWSVYVAAIFMKETLPKLYILIPSTLFTVGGVIFVSQPSFIFAHFVPFNDVHIDTTTDYEPLNGWGVAAGLIAAFCWMLCVLLIRSAPNLHFLQLEFASTGCLALVSLPALLLLNHYVLQIPFIGTVNVFDATVWKWDVFSVLMMLAMGLCGFGILSFSVIGYQLGEATQVSWLEYITIPMGFVYQTILFNDAPNKYECVGAIFVTIGCLLPLFESLYIYCNGMVKERLSNSTTRDDRETETDFDSADENDVFLRAH
eukprot:202446_1